MEHKSVCFAIPSGKGLHEKMSASLSMTIETLNQFGIKHNTLYCGGHFLESIRGKLVRDFLKGDCDTLFFIDSDQSFSPLDVITLLNLDEDVIAGVPCKKDYPIAFPVTLTIRENRSVGKMLNPTTALIQAETVGTGFMKISRLALDKLTKHYSELSVKEFPNEEPWIDMFGRIIVDGYKLGEDKSFCKRWKDIGGVIWIYPDITFGHWEGNYEFKGNFHQHLMNLKKQEEQNASNGS